MKRKEFLTLAGPALWLLAGGRIIRMPHTTLPQHAAADLLLRFGVASDGHYGQKDTLYDEYFKTLTDQVNAFHQQFPFSFFVINGDIVHDDAQLLPVAKQKLDSLKMPYYVTQGNHDHIDPKGWEAVWKMPVNHHFTLGRQGFLLLTSSDEKGTYLCPDLEWLQHKLHEMRHLDNVFVFIHINPAGLTRYAVNCDPVLEALAKYKNVRAVFNGHDHDMADVKVKNGIPFVFDGHFGGNWGVGYRGFRVVELMKNGNVHSYLMDPVNKLDQVSLDKQTHT